MAASMYQLLICSSVFVYWFNLDTFFVFYFSDTNYHVSVYLFRITVLFFLESKYVLCSFG